MNPLLKIIFLSFFIFATIVNAQEKKEMLFYVGITMVKPISELAKEFEKKNNCNIKILQGGSKDLYESIKSSKIGDIYLPGSVSYRNKNLKDGLLLDGKFVGFNKLALVVKKGNPKNIKASLDELTNENLRVVLGNAESGSVGNMTKNTLKKYGNYQESIMNALFLAPDSRTLAKAIIKNKADLILTWYATTHWDDNKSYMEALILDEKTIQKSKLIINLLSTSKNKELSKKFLDFAASKRGNEVFEKYGFLDEKDLKNFHKVKF